MSGMTALLLMLAACAQTQIQPMSKDTFKVATHAAPACGPAGARNVAFKSAAIEVIRKGGDKFVVLGDQSDSALQGDIIVGFQQNYSRGMVIRMVSDGSPEAGNALSAPETLGADWQKVVAKGCAFDLPGAGQGAVAPRLPVIRPGS